MEQNNQLINRLSKTYNDFKLVLTEGETTFSQFGHEFTGEKCPEQAELAPILQSFQKIVLAFSEFLKVLGEVLRDEDLIVSIQRMSPEDRPIGGIVPTDLLPFYWLLNDISHKLSHNKIQPSHLWELVYGLAVEYAYYGSSMTASSSLISQMGMLTGVFVEEDSQIREIFLEFAPKFFKPEYIKGLSYMSERAALLATASEEELRQAEISWWCNEVDATSKDEAMYYTLRGFIEGCPDPFHPEVVKRLKELAVCQGVQETIRKQARLKLKASGVL